MIEDNRILYNMSAITKLLVTTIIHIVDKNKQLYRWLEHKYKEKALSQNHR